MQRRIRQLQQVPNYKQALRETCRINKIAITLLNGLTTKKMRLIYQRTLRHYEFNPQKAATTWFQNELRIFHWILIIESTLLKLPLKQFNLNQWQQIQTYFPAKSPNMFQFEAKKLLGNQISDYSRIWLPEQCELLCRILEQKCLLNRWNEVARRFYELSDKRYYRSSKQCREQWFNHLDASKKHGQWNQDQDITILSFVLKKGRRWAQMCKELLAHRTEHMIKNRFKSLLAKAVDEKEKNNLNERKLIRKVLNKIKGINQTLNQPEFPIKNLKTFQTQNQDGELEAGDSFMNSQGPPKMKSSQQPNNNINQFINNKEENNQQNNGINPIGVPTPIHRAFTPYLQPNVAPTLFPNLYQLVSTFQQPHQFYNSFSFSQMYPGVFTIVNENIAFSSLETSNLVNYPIDNNIHN